MILRLLLLTFLMGFISYRMVLTGSVLEDMWANLTMVLIACLITYWVSLEQ